MEGVLGNAAHVLLDEGLGQLLGQESLVLLLLFRFGIGVQQRRRVRRTLLGGALKKADVS